MNNYRGKGKLIKDAPGEYIYKALDGTGWLIERTLNGWDGSMVTFGQPTRNPTDMVTKSTMADVLRWIDRRHKGVDHA